VKLVAGPHMEKIDGKSSSLQCAWAGPGCLGHRKALAHMDS